MQENGKARRPRGTGSKWARRDAAGRETWYGKWHVRGRPVKEVLGLRRVPGSRVGLTDAQAEAELRRRMVEPREPALTERVDVAEAGAR